MIQKNVEYNRKIYAVEADRVASSMQIKVNGIICDEVGEVGRVYYAVVSQPEELLLLLLQDDDVYLYDLEPDTDVRAYAKLLVGSVVPKPIDLLLKILLAITTLSDYVFLDVLYDKGLWPGHAMISLLGTAFITFSLWRMSEKLSLPGSKRKKLYCTGAILGILFGFLYDILVLLVTSL